MKKAIFISIILLFGAILKAQVMPEAFIGLLPTAPGNVCTEDTAGKAKFIRMLGETDSKLEQELSRRKEENEAKLDKSEDNMMENAMAKTGISPELTQKMMALEQQKKNAHSKEQRDAIDKKMEALTDEMLQESANISMDEVNNLKNMDEAGKKAWATGYASEKKAEVMADPEKYQQQNAAAMQDYQLVIENKRLSDSLNAQQTKYFKQFQEIDDDEAGKNILQNIAMLQKELDSTNGYGENEEQKRKTLREEIRNDWISYCNLLSPKYLKVLAQYKTFTQASLTPYYRLEKLSHQMITMQTGVKLDFQPGEFGLQQIRSYLGKLSDVYRYNHIPPKEIYIGEE